tara:strand:+ start:4074 stop:5198 length:1125 start_codon:yes stop_codon:yes gene_type:complete
MNLSIINFYLTDYTDSALPRHYEIFKCLKRQKINVDLYGCKQNHYVFNSNKVKKEENVYWVDSILYKNKFSRIISILLFFFKLIKKKKIRHSDYIYVTDPFLSFFFYISSFLFNFKLIYEVRDVWPKTLIKALGYKKNNILVIFLKIIEKLLLKKSKLVISNLENYHIHLNEINVKNKFFYLPNKLQKKNIFIKEENLNFIYAGYINKATNLNFLIKSFQNFNYSFKSSKLFIVGHGPLFKIFESENNNEFIIFKYTKSKNEIQKFVKKCSYGIISYNFDYELYKYGISPRKLIFYLENNLFPIFIGSFKMNKFLKSNYFQIKKNDINEFKNQFLLCKKKRKKICQLIIENYKNSYIRFDYKKITKNFKLILNG